MTEYEIRALQQQLHDALYTEVGFVDGKMGTRTRAGLFAFQTDNGLPATGEMNPETRAFILAHGVPTRHLAAERESATASSLAAAGRLPPAARAALKGGWWAKVQAALGAIAMAIYGAWQQSGDALSALSPIKEDLLSAGPWLFFTAVIVISLVLWLRSRSAVDQTVRAVRLGRDTGGREPWGFLLKLGAWLLSFASSGMVSRVLDTLDKRADAQTERERLQTEVTKEVIRAEVEARKGARDIALAESADRWSATRIGRWLIVTPWGIHWALIYLVSIINPNLGTTFVVQAVPTAVNDMALVLIPAIIIGDAGALAVRKLGGR
ncbi:peptidoglycan-binding protein [Ancylobacter dichloromethanicus]